MIKSTVLLLAGLGIGLAACGPARIKPTPPPKPPEGEAERVGKGFIAFEKPDSEPVVVDINKKPVKPKVVANFAGPPITNDWWSSLIWQRDPKNPWSYNMYPHPFAMRASAGGLGVVYPNKHIIKGRDYLYLYQRDFLVGLAGLESPDTRVVSYSDWAVTAEWKGAQGALRATFGHGLPFVYLTRTGTAPATVTLPADKVEKLKVFHEAGSVVGFTIDGRSYGLFAPGNAVWTRDGATFQSDLGARDYFSVAALPDDKLETLQAFRRHAYAFVTDTKATWAYDEPTATLATSFKILTELKDDQKGLSKMPIVALYRHQWLNSQAAFLPYEYVSPRGTMKTTAANVFTTSKKFNGVLPTLPDTGKYDKGTLEKFIGLVYREPDHFPLGLSPKPDRDSYWVGKSLGKLANVVQVADAVDEKEVRDQLLQAMANQLQDWFDGRFPAVFYYDKTWRTLVGLPQSYESGAAMNDHHFHYAYFIQAAAVLAQHRPEWAKDYGPMVDMLIKDPANWDRKDTRFPFLRSMDVYAGHSWANGAGQYEEGNNQESSSEEINFSTAVILWGAATGNKAIRDLGIFLYTTQVEAIEQYWFDVDQQVYPKGFDYPTAAIVWGAGGRYDTWFDQQPVMIHGINMLPFHGGSLYLGRRPDYVQRNYDIMLKGHDGYIYTWRDYALMFLALADGKKAQAEFDKDKYFLPEFGNSMAWTYYWIQNMAALGRPDTTVTASVPTHAVFKKGKVRTYSAYNPSDDAVTVKFSDGFELKVPPRQLVRGTQKNGAGDGDGLAKSTAKSRKSGKKPSVAAGQLQ
ncbi:MAG TPA: glycosyl hydrolase [Polyangia bacterium]